MRENEKYRRVENSIDINTFTHIFHTLIEQGF